VVNQIEEVFEVSLPNETSPVKTSTKIRFQCCESSSSQLLLGVLNTGAAGAFIKNLR
jgi:hypothetical protein